MMRSLGNHYALEFWGCFSREAVFLSQPGLTVTFYFFRIMCAYRGFQSSQAGQIMLKNFIFDLTYFMYSTSVSLKTGREINCPLALVDLP